MRRAYIVRYGAWGDQIHATHLPRLLKEREGFDHVTVEHNFKGSKIWPNHPLVDELVCFDPHFEIKERRLPYATVLKRLDVLKNWGKYEKFINLQNSLEYGQLAMEDTNDYYRRSEYRRKKFGEYSYYDWTTMWAGYPQHIGMVGELYFTEEEEIVVKKLFDTVWKDKFVLVVNLSGSNKHKLFYNSEQIVKSFLEKHKDAICITMGNKDCQDWLEFKGERIWNRANKYGFRQSMLTTKYADMVVSGESGLPIASTLFGIPTIQLMTAANILNHGGGFPNDYSIQSKAWCSPCHKGPYDYIGCPKFDYLGEKYPICIREFDPEEILAKMDHIYAISR